MSDSDRMQLAAVRETTFGELVTVSDLQILRHTGESLRQETNTVSSSEIRDDRQVSDVIRTNLNAAGDINLEVSYGAYDDFLEAGLMSAAWSTPVTIGPITTLSTSDVDNSINDSGDGLATIVANQWVKVSGFTTEANNGYFKVVSVASGKIVVSGGTLVTEVAGDSVTIAMGAQVVNGTTGVSYNIEKQFADLSNEFAILTGMTIDTFSLDIASDQILTGSFGFLGKQEVSAASSSGTGYTAATTDDVMNAVDDVTSILENQASFDTVSMSLQLQNNLRSRLQVGSLGAISIGNGTVDLTGTLQAYFESKTTMDKYRNMTATSLTIAIEDGDGNGYVIDMPRVKFTSGQQVAGGQSQDIIADLGFTAYMHATEEVTIRIARFPA